MPLQQNRFTVNLSFLLLVIFYGAKYPIVIIIDVQSNSLC
jgi:hypothetical protein